MNVEPTPPLDQSAEQLPPPPAEIHVPSDDPPPPSPTIPEGEKKEISDEEFQELLKKAKAYQEQHQKTLLQELVECARALNGYPYVSASMLTSLPEDESKYSLLTQTLILGFLLQGGKSVEDFKKAFVGTGVVFIQAHKGLPTLGEDGLYSGYDPDHHKIKTINVKRLMLCSDPKDFKPIIVARRGRDENGKMTFGKLEGDPYHKFTGEELAAVLKQGEEEQKLAKQEE